MRIKMWPRSKKNMQLMKTKTLSCLIWRQYQGLWSIGSKIWWPKKIRSWLLYSWKGSQENWHKGSMMKKKRGFWNGSRLSLNKYQKQGRTSGKDTDRLEESSIKICIQGSMRSKVQLGKWWNAWVRLIWKRTRLTMPLRCWKITTKSLKSNQTKAAAKKNHQSNRHMVWNLNQKSLMAWIIMMMIFRKTTVTLMRIFTRLLPWVAVRSYHCKNLKKWRQSRKG